MLNAARLCRSRLLFGRNFGNRAPRFSVLATGGLSADDELRAHFGAVIHLHGRVAGAVRHRAGHVQSSLNVWLSRTRGGIAIVTSIMAVIMAAMSGIIGGEVVLLGLIALPQMLRLGYNQNLAIGTICASGSLGTMIPPSIVLIFLRAGDRDLDQGAVHGVLPARLHAGLVLHHLHHYADQYEPVAGAAAGTRSRCDPTRGREKGLMFLALSRPVRA